MHAALATAIATTALTAAAAVAGPVDPRVEPALQALAAEMDPRAASTLASIDGTGRRLLAARAYLRASAQLAERWSWSATEAAAFAASPERRALDAAIARVRCIFESANPGSTLFVNREFRSLELQVDRWNANDSVGRAGDNLLTVASRLLTTLEPRDGGTGQQAKALRQLLLEHQPEPVPTLAAPGLSPHGRMRAIDFQVESAGRIVAGTDSAAIASEWIAGGWKERLLGAIRSADAGFLGPLTSPDEPWHYDFRPEAGQGANGDDFGCRAAA